MHRANIGKLTANWDIVTLSVGVVDCTGAQSAAGEKQQDQQSNNRLRIDVDV